MDFIYKFLENPSNLPSFLHTIGIALLTILIPISIAMFSREKEYVELDKNIILDEIFRPKLFLTVLGLIFLPALFWHISTFEFKIIELILWIFGIFLMIIFLKNSYSWIKGNKYKYRIRYLSNLKNEKDLIESMRSIWQKGDMDIKSEKDFLGIFSIKIEQYIKVNYGLTSILLRDFRNFLNNPQIYPPILLEFIFSKILEWYHLIWELKENRKYDKDKGVDFQNSLANYLKAKDEIDYIFIEIEKLALKDKLASESYFYYLESHIKGLLEKVDNNPIKILDYLEYFFKNFYSSFFPELSAIPETYDFWYHYFPEKWKITTENYTKDSLSSYSFKNFCNWAKGRIKQATKENDLDFEEAVWGLFPEVDHEIWIMILQFVLLVKEKNKMVHIIEHPWDFRKMGLLFGEERFSDTFKLAHLLFGEYFSIESLTEHINVLRKLKIKYREGSTEDRKRQRLLQRFEEMLNFNLNKKV